MPRGKDGGLLYYGKMKEEYKLNEICINYIDFEVVNDQVGWWRYTGVYGYSERGKMIESWNMLRNLAENLRYHGVLLVILTILEKVGDHIYETCCKNKQPQFLITG